MEVLAEHYAAIVLDLDGVCFRGDRAIPGAAETVQALRERGIAIAFATNNATRTVPEVAEHLRSVGIAAGHQEIVTSARAAAALLPRGTRCLVIGMAGLREALRERDCVEVDDPADTEAVVVGLDRNLTYDTLARATRALDAGARYLGTNADVSLPEAAGRAPGAGAVLAALSAATGREPEIAGKPERPLFEAAAGAFPPGRRLVVGDRFETDIVGGQRLGWDTALVLTGVTSAAEAARAEPPATYVLDDITGLLSEPRPRAPGGPGAVASAGHPLRKPDGD